MFLHSCYAKFIILAGLVVYPFVSQRVKASANRSD